MSPRAEHSNLAVSPTIAAFTDEWPDRLHRSTKRTKYRSLILGQKAGRPIKHATIFRFQSPEGPHSAVQVDALAVGVALPKHRRRLFGQASDIRNLSAERAQRRPPLVRLFSLVFMAAPPMPARPGARIWSRNAQHQYPFNRTGWAAGPQGTHSCSLSGRPLKVSRMRTIPTSAMSQMQAPPYRPPALRKIACCIKSTGMSASASTSPRIALGSPNRWPCPNAMSRSRMSTIWRSLSTFSTMVSTP